LSSLFFKKKMKKLLGMTFHFEAKGVFVLILKK